MDLLDGPTGQVQRLTFFFFLAILIDWGLRSGSNQDLF